jgi:Protease inhibitor Inh
MAIRFATLPLLLSTALLAGCWSTDRPVVENAANAAPSAAPPTSLAGKWTLSSAGAGSCAMTFGAQQPESSEGTIAPAGGCPYNFFTSRKWNYTTAGLVIRDHNAQTLAQLSPVGADRFEGQTSTGQTVSLSR